MHMQADMVPHGDFLTPKLQTLFLSLIIMHIQADMFPHGDFLLSSTNENDTYTDIQTLGANLAEEVFFV